MINGQTTKTLRVRLKDKHAIALSKWAFEANQVWNAANESSYMAWHIPVPEVGWIKGIWLSAYDVQKEVQSIRVERGFTLPSHSLQAVVAEHAKARQQFKKSKLRWRISSGAKRSLGWIPFKKGQLKWRNGQLWFAGVHLGCWDSYGLSQFEFLAGSFAEDSRGRWYCNVAVKVATKPCQAKSSVGIDLGLKEVATCSNGASLANDRHYKTLEEKLGKAQRAGKKDRARAIHNKIKNKRKDSIHKFTTRLVKDHAAIFVGDVSSPKLAKTKMAKSVLDAGWGMLKTQLKYKAMARSVVFEEVDEAYSTQTCSSCGEIPPSSPKGRSGLGMREWTCSECGAEHQRDINAAKNILAAGHRRLAVGIPSLQ